MPTLTRATLEDVIARGLLGATWPDGHAVTFLSPRTMPLLLASIRTELDAIPDDTDPDMATSSWPATEGEGDWNLTAEPAGGAL